MQQLQSVTSKVDALLTPRRVYHYSIMALLVMSGMYTLAFVFSFGPYESRAMTSDFVAQVTAGNIALKGDIHRLYDLRNQWVVQQELLAGSGPKDFLNAFLSPPIVAYLYAPFAALPYPVAFTLWLGLTICLLTASLRLLWPLVPNLHPYGFGRVLLVAFSCRAAFLLLIAGQDAAISLLLFVVGLRLLLAGRDTAAGSVLGLGVFKPQLFLLVPILLLLQRRWRALSAWMAVASTLAALSMALLGLAGTLEYIDLLTTSGFYQQLAQQLASKMISLTALARSFMPEPLPLLVVVAATIIVAALFARIASRPARHARQFLLLYVTMLLMNFVINPHFFVYDGVILFIPALLLLNEAPSRPSIRVPLAAAYILLFLSPLRSGAFGFAPLTVVAVIGLIFVVRQLLSLHDDVDVLESPDRVPSCHGEHQVCLIWHNPNLDNSHRKVTARKVTTRNL